MPVTALITRFSRIEWTIALCGLLENSTVILAPYSLATPKRCSSAAGLICAPVFMTLSTVRSVLLRSAITRAALMIRSQVNWSVTSTRVL